MKLLGLRFNIDLNGSIDIDNWKCKYYEMFIGLDVLNYYKIMEMFFLLM